MLKKGYSYTSTLPLGLRGLFYGKIYLYVTTKQIERFVLTAAVENEGFNFWMMTLFWVYAPRNSLMSRGCGETHCKFSRNAARCNHYTAHKLNRRPLISQQPPWKPHNLWSFILLSFMLVTAGRNHDVWILKRYMGGNYRPAVELCFEIESQSSVSFQRRFPTT